LSTKKIVITGGPGTGKTSIINTLKNNNYHCFDEIIRTLTLEAKKESDKSNHISNPIAFVKDPMEFNLKLLNGRVEQFIEANSITSQLCFFDRGIPDVLAYMKFFKQDYGNSFDKACLEYKYTQVFILPPWEAIYKSDNERFETFSEAVKIHEFLKLVYTSYGYNIYEVPFGSLENRTDFILNNLSI
jgi:predicted ATPase